MTTATPFPANPLTGRTVVVTGVSRRACIGHAIACRAADLGASLLPTLLLGLGLLVGTTLVNAVAIGRKVRSLRAFARR